MSRRGPRTRATCRACGAESPYYRTSFQPYYREGRRGMAFVVLCLGCLRGALATGTPLSFPFAEDDGSGPPEFYGEPRTVATDEPSPREVAP